MAFTVQRLLALRIERNVFITQQYMLRRYNLFFVLNCLIRQVEVHVHVHSNAKPQPCLHSPATTALQHVDGQLPQLCICVELMAHSHFPWAAAHTASQAGRLCLFCATMHPATED